MSKVCSLRNETTQVADRSITQTLEADRDRTIRRHLNSRDIARRRILFLIAQEELQVRRDSDCRSSSFLSLAGKDDFSLMSLNRVERTSAKHLLKSAMQAVVSGQKKLILCEKFINTLKEVVEVRRVFLELKILSQNALRAPVALPAWSEFRRKLNEMKAENDAIEKDLHFRGFRVSLDEASKNIDSVMAGIDRMDEAPQQFRDHFSTLHNLKDTVLRCASDADAMWSQIRASRDLLASVKSTLSLIRSKILFFTLYEPPCSFSGRRMSKLGLCSETNSTPQNDLVSTTREWRRVGVHARSVGVSENNEDDIANISALREFLSPEFIQRVKSHCMLGEVSFTFEMECLQELQDLGATSKESQLILKSLISEAWEDRLNIALNSLCDSALPKELANVTLSLAIKFSEYNSSKGNICESVADSPLHRVKTVQLVILATRRLLKKKLYCDVSERDKVVGVTPSNLARLDTQKESSSWKDDVGVHCALYESRHVGTFEAPEVINIQDASSESGNSWFPQMSSRSRQLGKRKHLASPLPSKIAPFRRPEFQKVCIENDGNFQTYLCKLNQYEDHSNGSNSRMASKELTGICKFIDPNSEVLRIGDAVAPSFRRERNSSDIMIVIKDLNEWGRSQIVQHDWLPKKAQGIVASSTLKLARNLPDRPTSARLSGVLDSGGRVCESLPSRCLVEYEEPNCAKERLWAATSAEFSNLCNATLSFEKVCLQHGQHTLRDRLRSRGIAKRRGPVSTSPLLGCSKG